MAPVNLTSLGQTDANRRFQRQFEAQVGRLGDIKKAGEVQQQQLLYEIGQLITRKVDLLYTIKQLTKDLSALEAKRVQVEAGIKTFAEDRLKELEDVAKGISREGLEFVLNLRHQVVEREKTVADSESLLAQSTSDLNVEEDALQRKQIRLEKEASDILLERNRLSSRLTAVAEAETLAKSELKQADDTLKRAKKVEGDTLERVKTLNEALEGRTRSLDTRQALLAGRESGLALQEAALDKRERELADRERVVRRVGASLKQRKRVI